MEQFFTHYIKTDDTMFRYARGPSIETGKEFHPFHEIIYFMQGDAEFISEDIRTKLEERTLILIPKETYHQLVLHGDKNNYLRCTIKFAESSYCEENITTPVFMRSDRNTEYLFGKLMEKHSDANFTALLEAVITLLLSEFERRHDEIAGENTHNTVVLQAIKYINENLYSTITIDEIAKECMISPSSLAHLFKKELGISPYKFIVKKRLISAYQRIQDGEPATLAAIECGFNEYSGFYKQYKKMFGVSPNKKINRNNY